ncbi:molybdenum cofactor guanylyltransferase MobA [Gilliamella sp. B2840]|uniref:molybdenum cofactor guanylyltransferase MobA n=1 Tax=unclassified Gilliamella TaxID=2685620 RepID=UPI00226A9646|nr:MULTISPECIES: molybdenum cofactor guanylyltransferase MobA [unclassified Gilliamella]MCX8656250.1 molybdenum cofactor guanylyltransferase MobA [Gilliamella sp. B2894]MCX8693246.1 molybdenum cofactor guanylyltransferase MobA [Gilliamella sp. B2881]MCX8695893.1 molybdenum cofactor guanylyltransferase MobA [Gilliamella sp. B2828]MCX8700319.1 molybdenum cofactor guanylyltransferase MobA [Gilliamella sp. B2840]
MQKLSITAIILAGGQSNRMNGKDKGLMLLAGKPLYQHVIDRIKPHVNFIMINCNRHIDQYSSLGYLVFCDDLKGFLGPLSGIYSGLLKSTTDWNLFVSCDTPFLPDDLIDRLVKFTTTHQAIYPFDGKNDHPTILLIHKSIAPQLNKYLVNGDRKLMLFLKQINAIAVDFSENPSGFTNINTLEMLEKANVLIKS